MVQLQQGRHVGTQGRNAVVGLQPTPAERGGEAVDTLAQFRIAVAAVKMYNRDALRMDRHAAVQERHGVELGATDVCPRRPRRGHPRGDVGDLATHRNLLTLHETLGNREAPMRPNGDCCSCQTIRRWPPPASPLPSSTKPGRVKARAGEMIASPREATIADDGLRRRRIQSVHTHYDALAHTASKTEQTRGSGGS